jgi:hypothetical protein
MAPNPTAGLPELVIATSVFQHDKLAVILTVDGAEKARRKQSLANDRIRRHKPFLVSATESRTRSTVLLVISGRPCVRQWSFVRPILVTGNVRAGPVDKLGLGFGNH